MCRLFGFLWDRPKGAESGGWGGIRTHERREPLPVFKTGTFNHSVTHPRLDFSHLPESHLKQKANFAWLNRLRDGQARLVLLMPNVLYLFVKKSGRLIQMR